MESNPERELPTVKVDEETLAAIDKGLRLAENGRRWTIDEAFDFVRKARRGNQ